MVSFTPGPGTAEVPVVYAGFWRRAGALLIDGLVSAPLFALQVVLFRASTTSAIVGLLVPGVALALYPAFFHARWGQTLGKMATRIKVVRANGDSIAVRHALLRSSVDLALWLVYTATTAAALATWGGPEWSSLRWLEQQQALREGNIVFGVYGWLSEVWVWSEVVVLLLNRRRRALHDFIAGTVVVRLVERSALGVPAVVDSGRSPNA